MARAAGNGLRPEYAVVGDRIREARQQSGLSLRALADRLGVSPSLISQVETGRARPSVSTLYAIVNELGMSLDELLFVDAPPTHAGPRPAGPPATPDMDLPHEPVQRAATRPAIRLASGVVWERLTTESMSNVDFFLVRYEVGGASSPEHEFQRHAGQEWGYVMSGRLGVTIGFDQYTLEPGDAIAFDSTTPHRLFNAGDEEVLGVWFVLGRRAPDVAPSQASRSSETGRR